MKNNVNDKINDALFNFYLEADKDTINNSLKEDIQNLDEYNKKKKQIVFLFKATANKKHNEHLLALANKFQEAILSNIEKPVSMLKQFIQGNASLSLYRNLDKLSKEDIIEIIKDKNLVQLLEQLEENESSH
jgi:folylpolyglutamate synthase/dihydropteroate synthase